MAYFPRARAAYTRAYASRPSYTRAYTPRTYTRAPVRRSAWGFELGTPFGNLKGNYKSGKRSLNNGASSVRNVRRGVRQITAPVAVGTSTTRMAPKIGSSRGGQLCFKNKEAIAQIALTDNTSNFETHSFVINPGLPLFPLASNLARCFQRYNMKVKFFFETNQPSSAQGQSLIIVNRNVQDPIPQTYPEFSSFMGCVTNPIWTNVECPGKGWIEANDKWLYTREGPVPATGDSLMYDLCRITMAFANMAIPSSVGAIGTLWCEYEICFDGAKLTAPISNSMFSTATEALTDDFTPALGSLTPHNGSPGGPFSVVQFTAGSSPATYLPNLPESSGNAFTPGQASAIVFSQPGYYRISVWYLWGGTNVGTDVYGVNPWQAYSPQDDSVGGLALISSLGVNIEGVSQTYNESYVFIQESATIDEYGGVVGSGAVWKYNGSADGDNQEPVGGATAYIAEIIIEVTPVDQQVIDLIGALDIGGGTYVPTTSLSADHRVRGSARMRAMKMKSMVASHSTKMGASSSTPSAPKKTLRTCKDSCCNGQDSSDEE